MRGRGLMIAAAVSACLTWTACREKGPAEKAGEKVDETVEKMKDAVDPKGPAEKAGRKIDKAVNP